MTKKSIEKRLLDEYPSGVELVYIDYRDSFSDDKTTLEMIAQKSDEIMDKQSDWMSDCEYDTIDYIIKEVFGEDAELDQDELEIVREWCYENDHSSAFNQLLKNTGGSYYFYDLGYEVPSLEYCEGLEVHQIKKEICKVLGIAYKDHKKDVDELVDNAFYGGTLTILFGADAEDIWRAEGKTIKFTRDYEICIMDRVQGSGWSVDFGDLELAFGFNRENLHNDEGYSGYSFSGDVCGMTMKDAVWDTDNSKSKEIKTNEDNKAFKEKEDAYEKAFKEGKCTAGDMKYSRHRNTYYDNNYPCGHHCKDCGTFWID